MIAFDMLITFKEIKIVSMFLLNVCCMLYKKGFITLQVFKCIGCQKKNYKKHTIMMWNYDLSD